MSESTNSDTASTESTGFQTDANPTSPEPIDNTVLALSLANEHSYENQTGDENEGNEPGSQDYVPTSVGNYNLEFSDKTAVNEELLEDFTSLAHELKITQGQAQKLADFYANQVGGGLQQYAKKLQEKEQHWRTEIKQQPGYRQSIADARRAMTTYASQELVDLFNHSRIGSHPAMVRFMSKVGRALAEPSAQTERPGRLLSTAEIFYPNQGKY